MHTPLGASFTASLARRLLLFGVISLLGNEFSTLLRYPELGAAVLYLPYAVLTAALVVAPLREWAWYIVVSVVTHFLPHWPQWGLSWILLADAANVSRALVAATLLRWLYDSRPRLDGIRELLLFIVSAVLVAPAVGATIGAVNVVWHGAAPTYGPPWMAWFMSNALTGLAMLPLCIAVVTGGVTWRVPIGRSHRVEAVLIASVLAGACTLAFLVTPRSGWELLLLLYAPLPVLVWAALRFSLGVTSLALAAVALAAIWSADHELGPFFASTPDDNVFLLQLFILLTTLPVLCIAAVASAHRGAIRLYRALLASLQDHVAILDAQGVVLQVNESWRRFADTVGAGGVDGVREGDDYLAVCRAAAARGDRDAARALAGVQSVLGRERRRFEMEYERSTGGLQEWYIVSIEALERLEGGAALTRANVSARRRAQTEIEEQRRELSHLARVAVLGQLSGALAHELNQPLTSILANAEAAQHLLRRQPMDVPELEAILHDIVAEDRRAGQVMQRLRAMLKRGEMHVQHVNAAELVCEVLELAHAELVTRRIATTSLVEPGLSAVLGDRVQLQQVLLNLILNGCEAMVTTAPADRTLRLTVRAAPPKDVLLSVRDGGTGIPPSLLERLFEPFVTTKAEGLGLGLSISKAIIAAHGGRLWAENNDDGGATLYCLLPAAPVEAAIPVPAVPS